jgi:hypothetical protein
LAIRYWWSFWVTQNPIISTREGKTGCLIHWTKNFPGKLLWESLTKTKRLRLLIFRILKTQREENHLILKKHRQRNHYLILVIPALERFLLKAADECGIPETEIPFSEKRLKDISKTQEAGKNETFKQFLNRIIQKKSPGTETLKTWLNEILPKER